MKMKYLLIQFMNMFEIMKLFTQKNTEKFNFSKIFDKSNQISTFSIKNCAVYEFGNCIFKF